MGDKIYNIEEVVRDMQKLFLKSIHCIDNFSKGYKDIFGKYDTIKRKNIK